MCAIWPTDSILLELIPLLHNISNCYNMKNHVNSPDGLWKLSQVWHKMFSFLGCENWHMTIKLLSVHTKTKHSPWFLSRQGIVFQFSAVKFLSVLLPENSESFITLKLFLSHMMLHGLEMNGSARILVIQHHISNKCTSILLRIFAQICKETYSWLCTNTFSCVLLCSHNKDYEA
jgi:hypothetical protein